MSTAPPSPHESVQHSLGSLPELDIWNWPLIDSGWRSLIVASGTMGVGFVSGRVSGSWLMGAMASLALMISMWPFWIPLQYAIGTRGIVVSCLGFRKLIPWRLVKRCRLRKRGIVLLFHDQELFFDGFRSKYIDGRDQRDQLIEAIQFYQQPDPNQVSGFID